MQFKKLLILVTLFMFVLFNCTDKKDFNFKSNWKWQDLENFAKTEETKAQIANLQKQLSLAEARFLFKEIKKLDNPAQIKELSTLEKKQEEWGGSFYGYIPKNFQDPTKIPVPDNFENTIKTGLYLANIKNKIHKILAKPDLKYNVNFRDEKIAQKKIEPLGSALKLHIDISAVEEVLELYENDISLDEAKNIAGHDVFKEMLKHRRNLGYVPAPLPDTTDLAKFIYSAGSGIPIHIIWNWLNPCNMFCFSDLYRNKKEFRKLLNYIDKNQEQLSYNILKRIDNFIADDFSFSDQLSFGVNFGIRSWATDRSVGTNIVQVKDDFETLTRTMRHEIFHHVQLAMLPLAPNRRDKENPDFSDLTYWNFNNQADRKFYEVLSYIFLEGTATYVGGKPKNWIFFDQVKKSVGMLDQIYSSNYNTNKPEIVEQVVNMGMSSNGPFYGLGYLMARTIKMQLGEEELKKALRRGPLYFFKKYYDYRLSKPKRKFIHITDRVGKKINQLYDIKYN